MITIVSVLNTGNKLAGGGAAVVDTSNVLYLTGGILLCLKTVKGKDTDPAIVPLTCGRLVPGLLAIKQQIYM